MKKGNTTTDNPARKGVTVTTHNPAHESKAGFVIGAVIFFTVFYLIVKWILF